MFVHERVAFQRIANEGCRRSVSFRENMLVSREPSFASIKGKPVSAWLISKFSNIFFYKSSFRTSNLWPVFGFALSTMLPRSSLLTVAYATPTSYVIRWNATLSWTGVRQLVSFLHKCLRRPLLTVSREEHFLWCTFFASKSWPPFIGIIKLGRPRTFFNITPTVFVWRKESQIHLEWLEGK